MTGMVPGTFNFLDIVGMWYEVLLVDGQCVCLHTYTHNV